ncbi:MAG: hypothetical protein IJZ85_11130 [Lachnospiraceae bacterium]|nr:hypothetical protein [Lachnospiraceae bacterium]
MNTLSWKEHPALKNMDHQKLKWLEKLAEQTASQKPDNILPFLLAVNSHAQKKGIHFTDEETDVILCVLKENMTPDEQRKVDSMRKMLAGMMRK